MLSIEFRYHNSLKKKQQQQNSDNGKDLNFFFVPTVSNEIDTIFQRKCCMLDMHTRYIKLL